MAELKNPRITIVGAESLIGREIREILSGLTPEPITTLISGEADSTRIARDDEGEAIILSPMRADSFDGAQCAILAGTPESSRRAFELTAAAGTPLIDLTGALEDQGTARLRAPLLEASESRGEQHIHLIAHPAAVSLAIFYARLARRWAIRHSVLEVFEPASERGQKGLHELQTQTVNLLAFKPLPKDVFDIQISFNMLPAYGSEAPVKLDDCEARIERHLATLLLLSSRAPMPSLRLVASPVFHGYSMSAWVEFESAPGLGELEGALASVDIEVRTPDEEPPTNVAIAGMSGLAAGNIRPDRNNPRAFWFWLVNDNIRTFADTAVAVIKEYL